MPEVDPGFSVKKPVSVWNRPLKADAKGIFKSAGKAVLHGATGQWTSLGADVVEGPLRPACRPGCWAPRLATRYRGPVKMGMRLARWPAEASRRLSGLFGSGVDCI